MLSYAAPEVALARTPYDQSAANPQPNPVVFHGRHAPAAAGSTVLPGMVSDTRYHASSYVEAFAPRPQSEPLSDRRFHNESAVGCRSLKNFLSEFCANGTHVAVSSLT